MCVKHTTIKENSETLLAGILTDRLELSMARYIFAKAIEELNVDRSKIVFVGDSLEHDIAGAKAAGLSSVWINTGMSQINQSTPVPELIIKDLRDLIER